MIGISFQLGHFSTLILTWSCLLLLTVTCYCSLTLGACAGVMVVIVCVCVSVSLSVCPRASCVPEPHHKQALSLTTKILDTSMMNSLRRQTRSWTDGSQVVIGRFDTSAIIWSFARCSPCTLFLLACKVKQWWSFVVLDNVKCIGHDLRSTNYLIADIWYFP